MRFLLYTMTLHIFLHLADTQQVCPPTEIVFLLDQSETALLASTDNIHDSMTYFNLVKVALDRFLLNPLIVVRPNQVRVGVFGYSSTRPGESIVPEGTSPLQALTLTHLVAKGTSAGSWTYRGLQAIQRRPAYDNNYLIIVSSMGSNSSSRRSLAVKEVQRVRELGWTLLVIAVQGRNPLDLVELTMVNGGITPVVLDDGEGRGYTRLASHLDGLVCSIICLIQATLDTVTQEDSSGGTTDRMDMSLVCQPTEILLLLDESQAARLAASDEPDNQETKFNILKSAMDSLLANQITANSRNTFRIGAYGYSDPGHQNTIIPEGTSPAMARDYTYLIGRNASLKSQSLTYSGLEMVRHPPSYPNNRLILVSARGSWSSSQRSLAQNEIGRVQKLGWSPLVIAVQGRYPIDTEELVLVNGGKQFVTLDDFSDLDPKSYRLLPAAFDNIVNNLLCPDTPGTEATKSPESTMNNVTAQSEATVNHVTTQSEATVNHVTTQSEATMNNVTTQSVTRVESTESSLQSVATTTAITNQVINGTLNPDIVSEAGHAPNTDILSETRHAPNTTVLLTANDTLNIITTNDTLNIVTTNDTLNIITAHDSTNVTPDNPGKIVSP